MRAEIQDQIEQLGETVQQKEILRNKAEITYLRDEERKIEQWIEENDIPDIHGGDQYFLTEIQERKTKIFEKETLIQKRTDTLEKYKDDLKEIADKISAIGFDEAAVTKRVNRKLAEISKIDEEFNAAQNSRDVLMESKKS